MNKRGQSEVITTVLIILLVLAAVFIVYTAVRNMVTTSTEKGESQANCIGTTVTIVKATNATSNNLQITREVGGVDTGVTVRVLVKGIYNMTTSTALTELASDSAITVDALKSVALNTEVKVAPVLADGTICGVSDTAKVVVA